MSATIHRTPWIPELNMASFDMDGMANSVLWALCISACIGLKSMLKIPGRFLQVFGLCVHLKLESASLVGCHFKLTTQRTHCDRMCVVRCSYLYGSHFCLFLHSPDKPRKGKERRHIMQPMHRCGAIREWLSDWSESPSSRTQIQDHHACSKNAIDPLRALNRLTRDATLSADQTWILPLAWGIFNAD